MFVHVYRNLTYQFQLFADTTIQYAGQPVGVVIAKSQIQANKAADKVIVNVEMTGKPVLDMKAIVDSGDQSRIFKHAEKAASEQKSKSVIKLLRKINRISVSSIVHLHKFTLEKNVRQTETSSGT